MKKGQINTSFIYILSMVIIAVVLVVGYKIVLSVGSSGKEYQQIKFKNHLNDFVTDLSDEYGTAVKFSYNIDDKITKICFIDTTKRKEIQDSPSIDEYPLMKNGLETENNVYFFNDKQLVESVEIKGIQVITYPYFKCIQTSGRIEMWLEGTGKGTIVLTELRVTASPSPSYPVTVTTTDGLMDIIIPAGSTDEPEISVTVAERVNDEQVSDTYVFEPEGTVFDPPMELSLTYFPSLVGECPESLKYVYTLNNGEEDEYDSSAIDCAAHKALFYIERI